MLMWLHALEPKAKPAPIFSCASLPLLVLQRLAILGSVVSRRLLLPVFGSLFFTFKRLEGKSMRALLTLHSFHCCCFHLSEQGCLSLSMCQYPLQTAPVRSMAVLSTGNVSPSASNMCGHASRIESRRAGLFPAWTQKRKLLLK